MEQSLLVVAMAARELAPLAGPLALRGLQAGTLAGHLGGLLARMACWACPRLQLAL